MSKSVYIIGSLLVLSLGLYISLGYWIERHETTLLLGAYSLVFGIFLIIYVQCSNNQTQWLIICSLLLRLSLFFSLPALSDDFYRFLWDGLLMREGYHPFAHPPVYYLDHHFSLSKEALLIYPKLNSPHYFTVYPPLAQGIAWLATAISPHSIFGAILVMRTITLFAEVGNLWLLSWFVKKYTLPRKRTLLYALNPLVILELTGNLHHESILLFLVLLSLFFITLNKQPLGGISLGMAIATKLIPLLFFPLLLKKIGWKSFLMIGGIATITTITLFLPLMSYELIVGMTTGIGYYFAQFEFNGSLFYLIKALGYYLYGYNMISILGPLLGLLSLALIVGYSVTRPRLTPFPQTSIFEDLLLILVVYYLCALILHPWYVTSLVAFSLLTPWRFPIVWAYLIFLTYAGYSKFGFHENLWIVSLEYSIVCGYLAFEYKTRITSKVL